MRSQEMTGEEIVRRGQEIYEQSLRRVLEPAQNGRYVVINIENRDYAVADTTTQAGAVMRARYPDQVFYELRIGHDAVTLWSSPELLDAARKH